METIIATGNLLGPASSLRFRDAVRSVRLSDIPFLQGSSLIQEDHLNGAPNNSFASTYEGAMQAVYAIGGKSAFSNKAVFRMFGNNISESLDIVRSFYNIFIRK